MSETVLVRTTNILILASCPDLWIFYFSRIFFNVLCSLFTFTRSGKVKRIICEDQDGTQLNLPLNSFKSSLNHQLYDSSLTRLGNRPCRTWIFDDIWDGNSPKFGMFQTTTLFKIYFLIIDESGKTLFIHEGGGLLLWNMHYRA